jgi:hypothetical protein
MNKKLLKKAAPLFLAAMLLCPTFSNSQQTLRTYGMVDCGEWVQANEKIKPLYKAWLQGFLSGMNLSGTKDLKSNYLEKLNSMSQAYVFVDNYCQKNPLKNTIDAAFNLIIELDNSKK